MKVVILCILFIFQVNLISCGDDDENVSVVHNDVDVPKAPDDLEDSKKLEKLSFVHLLEKAQTSNVTLSSLIVDIFKRNYASRTFAISGPIWNGKSGFSSVFESQTTILFYNFEAFSFTLRLFGHYIHKIEIDYNAIEMIQREGIHSVLTEFCSESLTSVKLVHWDGNVLSAIKKPLPMVHNLTISGNLSSNYVKTNETLELNEVFIELRQLSLDYIYEATIFDISFQQLENVKITFVPAPLNEPLDEYFDKTKSAMVKLFEKNPLIRQLHLVHCNSLDYVKIAQEKLLMLNELQIEFASLQDIYEGGVLDFKSVKYLDVKLDRNIKFFDVTTFDVLDEVVLTCTDKKCKGFPLDNNSVKKVRVDGYYFDILVLAKDVPKLEELFVDTYAALDLDSMIAFVEKSSTLKKLSIRGHSEQLLRPLARHFAHRWKVTSFPEIFQMDKLF